MRNPLLTKDRKEYRLAEKLRRLRGLRGLTQKEVAQAASIDESTVRNYELARRMPKPEHVRGLAAALEVMPEALISFDDAANQNELFLMLVEIAGAYGFEFGPQRRLRLHRPYEGLLHPRHRKMGEGVRSDAQKRGSVPGRLRAVEGRVP